MKRLKTFYKLKNKLLNLNKTSKVYKKGPKEEIPKEEIPKQEIPKKTNKKKHFMTYSDFRELSLEEVIDIVKKNLSNKHFTTIESRNFKTKPFLNKEGAVFFASLFGLKISFNHKIIELDNCHREYRTNCSLFEIETGFEIVNSNASCNTREKQYLKGDPFQHYNVVEKMAQKRALVGSVLFLKGMSNLFTQDEEYVKQMRNEDNQNTGGSFSKSFGIISSVEIPKLYWDVRNKLKSDEHVKKLNQEIYVKSITKKENKFYFVIDSGKHGENFKDRFEKWANDGEIVKILERIQVKLNHERVPFDKEEIE